MPLIMEKRIFSLLAMHLSANIHLLSVSPDSHVSLLAHLLVCVPLAWASLCVYSSRVACITHSWCVSSVSFQSADIDVGVETLALLCATEDFQSHSVRLDIRLCPLHCIGLRYFVLLLFSTSRLRIATWTRVRPRRRCSRSEVRVHWSLQGQRVCWCGSDSSLSRLMLRCIATDEYLDNAAEDADARKRLRPLLDVIRRIKHRK